MRWTSETLFGLLGKHYQLFRRGKAVPMGEFALPVVVEGRTLPLRSGIFITTVDSIPESVPPRSFLICVGPHPDTLALPFSSDIVFVEDDGATVTGVLNTLQHDIENLMRWSLRMQTLANSGSDVKQLVELSIPVFTNRITIVDYDLKVLAYCEADKSTNPWTVRMVERYARVPAQIVAPYVERLKQSFLKRDPFFFIDPVGNNYCINLYEGDTYLGCCSLTDEVHPIEPFETELFEIFADAVFRALKLQSRQSSEQIATMRTVLTHMIRRQQVSNAHVQDAIGLVERGLKHPLADHEWRCIVIGNANSAHEIPEGYAQRTIEELLLHSFAIPHEGGFVVFALLRKDKDLEYSLFGRLDSFLCDMNFRAGVSRPFENVYGAYVHYRQADRALANALETGSKRWVLFDDIVLDYLLEQCCGEFDQEDLAAPELVQLAQLGPGRIGLEYLDTLRIYLDTECNGSQTAELAFLHRSTLAQRINRIKEIVDLSTPEKRLYLRLCLHMPDIDWEKITNRG